MPMHLLRINWMKGYSMTIYSLIFFLQKAWPRIHKRQYPQVALLFLGWEYLQGRGLVLDQVYPYHPHPWGEEGEAVVAHSYPRPFGREEPPLSLFLRNLQI